MMIRSLSIALAAAIALTMAPREAAAHSCPHDVECTEFSGAGKKGSYFRISVPENWDGDLVLVNHGFDLNRKNIRGHHRCQNMPVASTFECHTNADCGMGAGAICNEISFMGLDEILLPMGKAVAASTYSKTGWAVFDSRKDLGEILKYIKKTKATAKPSRVIVTGFSLGGAVTVDAVLRMKVDGAVPLCGAVAGGVPTWDTAVDVRLVYDFLCSDVPGAAFTSPADVGEVNSSDSGSDAIGMALKVNACFGILFPSDDVGEAAAQAQRLGDFRTITAFSGTDGEVAFAMGFATLGMGDFVRDKDRLGGKRIGWNEGPRIDYATIGSDAMLAGDFDAAATRLTKGKGRKKLSKASLVDFTKGRGKKVGFPILSLAGAVDYVVIPEFQRTFQEAASLGGKLLTQSWVSTPGHCVFTEEELTAVYNEYFAWLDSADHAANQPTPQDIEDACLALPTGNAGTTCNFDPGFEAPYLGARIPVREDWTPGAQVNP